MGPLRPVQGSYLPERRHPEFGAGNEVSVTSGCVSVRVVVSARTSAVRLEYMDRYPWLSDAHEVKLDMFFTDKARYDLLTGWMYDVLEGRKKSHVQGKGRPRSGDLLAIPEYVLTELTAPLAGVVAGGYGVGFGCDGVREVCEGQFGGAGVGAGAGVGVGGYGAGVAPVGWG